MPYLHKTVQVKSCDVEGIEQCVGQNLPANADAHGPVYLLSDPAQQYTAILAPDRLQPVELAAAVSRCFGVPCIYTECWDFEYYSIALFKDGALVTKKVHAHDKEYGIREQELDFTLFCDTLGLNNVQREKLQQALTVEIPCHAIWSLEEALGMHLHIDYRQVDSGEAEKSGVLHNVNLLTRRTVNPQNFV